MARLNKHDVVAILAQQNPSYSKRELLEIVEDFLNIITDKVIQNDVVALVDFGKFEKYKRLDGTYSFKFRTYKALSALVNEPIQE